jgi:hypothetical protein
MRWLVGWLEGGVNFYVFFPLVVVVPVLIHFKASLFFRILLFFFALPQETKTRQKFITTDTKRFRSPLHKQCFVLEFILKSADRKMSDIIMSAY